MIHFAYPYCAIQEQCILFWIVLFSVFPLVVSIPLSRKLEKKTMQTSVISHKFPVVTNSLSLIQNMNVYVGK